MANHKKLFIVESPGKIKTLQKILGPEYVIKASYGHITELAYSGPGRLGFSIHGDKVLTQYELRGERAEGQIKALKSAAKAASMVVLATDPDREGEAIAWHLAEVLQISNPLRVTFTEITAKEVQRALGESRAINSHLVGAQRARQCLDKLVGFEVSPILWNSSGGKSAGRVQSAALHILCARERERLAFQPETYFVVKAFYKKEGVAFHAFFERFTTPVSPVGDAPLTEKKSSTHALTDKDKARFVVTEAETKPHIVRVVDKKQENKAPPPPLITSSLQQLAGVRYKLPPASTMKIAQELYEGAGSGKGLITYMRTDSFALSKEFIFSCRDYLTQNDASNCPDKPRFFKASQNAQEAHEAIRPTNVFFTPDEARRSLNDMQAKVYELIWNRAVASQCVDALLSKQKVLIDVGVTEFSMHSQTIDRFGYLKYFNNVIETDLAPSVAAGEQLHFEKCTLDEKQTEPPPRYSEPKLIQMMEKLGIGRPSTYAPTIATLKDRAYAVIEKQHLVPTALGLASDEALMKAFPEIVDTQFTAAMEQSLDDIAQGKLDWQKYFVQFVKNEFEPKMAKARTVVSGMPKNTSSAPLVRGQPGGSLARTKSGGGRASPASGGKTSGKYSAEEIAAAVEKAKKNNVLPQCTSGHGDLALLVSKAGAFYWRCQTPGCDVLAWYQEFSREKCPECANRLEKIKSKKVSGGYFLKCKPNAQHPAEIVLFRDKKTKAWRRASARV